MENKTIDGFSNVGHEGQDYFPRAYFMDEMEAETYMMDNLLETGFYEKIGDWYTVFEWGDK
jgi:hypothetical protein